MKQITPAVLLSTLWIALSEFLRNELLLKSEWLEHYSEMGLTFPSEPLNGAVWGIWSLMFSVLLMAIGQRFSLLHTILIGWISAFLMMWIAIGNLGVLPFSILPFAIPLSALETAVAVWIQKRFTTKSN